MSAIKLYVDPISGNCHKTLWTASYVGADVDVVEFDILKGDTRTPEFLAINPFGQIPTAVLPNQKVLTQSNAIAVYLAEHHVSPLLPQEAGQRADVFKWLFWEQNSHEPYIAGRRFRKAYRKLSDEEIDAEWLPRGYAALAYMEEALADGDYLVGDALTLADICVVAYTRTAEEGGFTLSDYPRVVSWIARVEDALNIPKTEH